MRPLVSKTGHRRRASLYILSLYIYQEAGPTGMETKLAKLFSNGGSQAVRLPSEFRFDGDEVYVRRDPLSGDVILSARPGWKTWREFFALRDATGASDDALSERPANEPGEPRDPFSERA
jgi:antitoxin VapB